MIKIIEGILLLSGGVNLFSSVIYTFTETDDHWLWFSRLALSMICLGLYAILKKLDKCGLKN